MPETRNSSKEMPVTLLAMLDRNSIERAHVVWWQSPHPVFTFGPRGPLRPTTFIGLAVLTTIKMPEASLSE